MSDQKGQHEPSMEEILASIRRIIAEDGEQPAPAPAKEPPPPAGAPKPDEILELTEVVEEERAPKPAVAAPPEPEPPKETPMHSEPIEASPSQSLVSDAAAAASLAALSQLKQIGERSEQRMSDIPVGEGQRTIEGMVREMLIPLLKEWLDSNLPHIVERIVQEEVERLVRASRGR